MKNKNFIYGVIYSKSLWKEGEIDIVIPDGADVDVESAYGWYEAVTDDDAIDFVVHHLNPNDYWVGYFYFNDMEEADKACSVECNSREHLDAHWETNGSGGHYDCTKYEHVVNGNIIETIYHNEQESERN